MTDFPRNRVTPPWRRRPWVRSAGTQRTAGAVSWRALTVLDDLTEKDQS